MPFSAAFYSLGAARDIPGESREKLEAELHDSNQDYYVIENSDMSEFPPDGFGLTEEVAQFGKYELRRERDAQDLPVASRM
jgi:hypothetical protein